MSIIERSSTSAVIFAGLLFLVSLAASANAQFLDLKRTDTGVMKHDEWTTQVRSSQGKLISAGVDGRVAIWDAATGNLLRDVTLQSMVLTLSVSKDGRTIAAGDASGTVSIIDVESGKTTSTFVADKNLVNASAWTDDGNYLAAGGPEGVVRIWSNSDKKITGNITPAAANVVALEFTGSQLVIGVLDPKNVKRSAEVWDWQNSKLVRTFDEGAAGVRAISVSPDGKLLAIADYQKATLLNMVPTTGNGAEISLRVLPDSDKATIIAVWDLTTGKRTALIEAETGARSIAFSPDGQMLAAAGVNGVMIFDVGHRLFTEIGRLDSRTSIDSIAFAADSKQLLVAREREPLVTFGAGGIDKIVDPLFTSLTLRVREGTNVGVNVTPPANGAKSITGGSNLEIWQIIPRQAEPDAKTFEGVRAVFENRPEEGRKILQQVIKDFPKNGDAQRLYALFFESKDVKNLQSLVEASVKADPNCVACWRSMGDIQFMTDNAVGAVKSYDQALKLRPEYGLVAGHQADAYGKVGLDLMSSQNTAENMKAAQDALTRALILRPANEHFYTNLGAAYYFRSEFDTDISLLTIALKLRPDQARIYYNLGHAYRYKGDKQKAIENYRRYVQMGEEGEEDRVEKAKGLIKELSK